MSFYLGGEFWDIDEYADGPIRYVEEYNILTDGKNGRFDVMTKTERKFVVVELRGHKEYAKEDQVSRKMAIKELLYSVPHIHPDDMVKAQAPIGANAVRFFGFRKAYLTKAEKEQLIAKAMYRRMTLSQGCDHGL